MGSTPELVHWAGHCPSAFRTDSTLVFSHSNRFAGILAEHCCQWRFVGNHQTSFLLETSGRRRLASSVAASAIAPHRATSNLGWACRTPIRSKLARLSVQRSPKSGGCGWQRGHRSECVRSWVWIDRVDSTFYRGSIAGSPGKGTFAQIDGRLSCAVSGKREAGGKHWHTNGTLASEPAVSTFEFGSRICKPNSVRGTAPAGRPFLWAAHRCAALATYPEV